MRDLKDFREEGKTHRMTCCSRRAAPSAGGAADSKRREYVSSVRSICESAAAFSAASSAQWPDSARRRALSATFCKMEVCTRGFNATAWSGLKPVIRGNLYIGTLAVLI